MLASLLGILSTVLVAWGCALWIDTPKLGLVLSDSELMREFMMNVAGAPAARVIDRSAPDRTTILDARGFPFLAMRGGYEIDSPDGRGTLGDLHDAILLDIRPQLPGNDKTALPLLPLGIIWRGFVFDSLIFAAAWFALLAGPGMIRRLRRRRRGACVACGYDLRGTAHHHCSECGVALLPDMIPQD